MSVTDLSLMFQYVTFQINSVPYGIRNINSYSDTKIQNLTQGTELISFIRPADWMMFTAPKGIDFRCVQNNLGITVKDTMDKLNVLDEFRTNELMNVINKQYDNVCLEASNKLRVNSVVLLKYISYEAKREPFRLARVDEIKKSRDDTQRVVVVTYQNVNINKRGEWVGYPVTVERCVSDAILVDDALNESMFNPSSKIQENEEKSDDQETMKRRQTAKPLNEAITEEGKLNDSIKTKTKETQFPIDLEINLDSLGNAGHRTHINGSE